VENREENRRFGKLFAFILCTGMGGTLVQDVVNNVLHKQTFSSFMNLLKNSGANYVNLKIAVIPANDAGKSYGGTQRSAMQLKQPGSQVSRIESQY
jgi:hypothetical protein